MVSPVVWAGWGTIMGGLAEAYQRYAEWARLAALVAVAAASAAVFALGNPNLVDDNYTTYRVARMLAEGNGPVFNLGDHIMPVTSPLWTLFLGACLWLFQIKDLPQFANHVSLVLLCLACYPLYAILRRSFGWIAVLTPLAIFCAAWKAEGAGNEVPLVICAGLWAIWSYQGRRSLPLTGVLLGVTYLARGDGLLLAVAIGVAMLLDRFGGVHGIVALARRDATANEKLRPALRDAGLLIAGFLLIAIPWHAYFAIAFGGLFPRSLGVKIIQGQSTAWPSFHEFLWPYAKDVARGNVLLLLLAVVGLVRVAKASTILIVWLVLHLLAYSALGVPNYEWYYYPLFLLVPLGLIGFVRGLADTLALSPQQPRLFRMAVVASTVALITGSMFIIRNGADLNRYIGNLKPERETDSERYNAYREVAAWMNENARVEQGRPLAMALEIGIMGFFMPGIDIVDPPGILRPEVALDNVNDWRFVVRRYNPDYLIFREIGSEDLVIEGDGEAKTSVYRLVHQIDWPEVYHQKIFKRLP